MKTRTLLLSVLMLIVIRARAATIRPYNSSVSFRSPCTAASVYGILAKDLPYQIGLVDADSGAWLSSAHYPAPPSGIGLMNEFTQTIAFPAAVRHLHVMAYQYDPANGQVPPESYWDASLTLTEGVFSCTP